MLGNAHLDQLRRSFADQFSGDGHSFVYRKYQTGAPIRVSAAEKDDFIAAFNKRIRYVTGLVIPATVALIFLLVWLIPDADSVSAQVATGIGMIAMISLFLVAFHRAWGAPSRALERRTPEGLALSKEDARALAFSRITYGQLALAALMGVGLVWKMSTEVDVTHGWGMVWPAFGGAIVMFSGVQAIRKWRFRQR